jgi:DNA-binding transcriptional ArsR family regulator
MNMETVSSDVSLLQLEAESEHRTKGFFRVDHNIFQDKRLRQLSGDCFRIFLWMSSRAWRFPLSRGFLRASISMIHLSTGVSEATVSRALSELKKAALIRLVKVDRKAGNRWWVESILGVPQNEGTQIRGTQVEGSVPSKRKSSTLNMRLAPIQNEGHIRSIKEINKEEEEAKNLRLAWEYFQREFPAERDREEKLKIMLERFTGNFKPPKTVMQNLVVREWFLTKNMLNGHGGRS